MSDHSAAHSAPAHGHGHGHDAHDVSKAVKKYLFVFGALLVGTLVTVAAAKMDFGSSTANIAVALFIATVKAALVAGYFMHLLDERKLIYGVLGATVFFFIGLMYLTIWSMEPENLIHIKQMDNPVVMQE